MPEKWSYTVGEYGYTVTVEERRVGGNLYIRYTGIGGRTRRESLGHKDRARAKRQARDRAATMLRAEKPRQGAPVTIDYVLSLYLENVTSKLEEGSRKWRRDPAHAETWVAFLTPGYRVADLDENDMREFERARKAGEIQPEGRNLKPGAKGRTIGCDIDWLKCVLNWATRTKHRSGPLRGKYLLDKNPIRGYKSPKTKEPNRPVATWERFQAVRKHATKPRFRHYMDIIEAQGWRLSAVRQLEVRHVRLGRTRDAPYGRLYRPPLKHEEGAWVPMKERTRLAIESLLGMAEGVGRWPLFPAPQATEEDGRPKPWTRSHVHRLYQRAERAAVKAGDLSHTLEGSALHAYRRKWATEHKHLPSKDVMAYAGWKHEKTMRDSYEHVDSGTTLSILENERKLREGEA